MKFPRPSIKVFNNGLTVLVVPWAQSPSVKVSILVRAGTAYEDKKTNGISHFLEHMCFKGTQKRPRPIDISSAFDVLGASYNAFTGRDLTGYWGKVSVNHFDDILDLLSDMYLNPSFSPTELEKERGVIIEEINMYEDDPRAKVSQVLEKTMYGDQHAGWDVAGEKHIIKKITKNDFVSYRSKHYHANKTLVVVSGGISYERALKKVSHYFSNIFHSSSRASYAPIVNKQTKPLCTTINKKLDQTHFVAGIKAFPVASPKRRILSMLSGVLGGGLSSRLFQRIREEMGAAYYIGSSPTLYKTHGYFEIYGGINHQKIQPVLEAIMEECTKIARDGVTDEELSRVKEHAIGTFLLSLETPSDMGSFYSSQVILGEKMKTPQRIIDEIKKVSSSSIKRLARELFVEKRTSLAIIGPHKNSEAFLRLIRFH